MVQVGDRIRDWRLKRNLTQLDLAVRADISQSYLARIERNQTNL